MNGITVGRMFAAAVMVLLAVAAPHCKYNSGNTASNEETITIEYQRFSLPCPSCPDEPWPYLIVYGTRLTSGSFLKVGENSYRGTIRGPLDIVMSLSVNDRRMFDGRNDCSWSEVGQLLKVNGYPVHINSQDCPAPWSGLVKIIVHGDGSVTQPD